LIYNILYQYTYQMPIGYTPTSKGNISLTFPYIADQYRSLGYENFPNVLPRAISVEHGGDEHGWGADANRMAMGKVQATRSIQRIFDRTPRFRIQPSGNTAQMPMFASKDESMEALRRWTGGVLSGAGTAGALTTPAGERYKRRMLDARAEQFRNQLQGFDTPLPPEVSHEKELSKKEAMKTQSSLEFTNILNQFQSGDNNFLQLGTSDLQKWLTNFYQLLPYYDRNDVDELVKIDDALEEIWKEELGNLRFEGLRLQFNKILEAYMSIINFTLPQRVQAMKTILRSIGLAGVAKGVIAPTPQDVADEMAGEFDYQSLPTETSYPSASSGGDGFDDKFDEVEPLVQDKEVVPVPPEEQRNLPQYRTQAEITAEARRRQQEYRTPMENSIYDIAVEWSPYTNYNPRADTRASVIRQTLVQRIKRVLANAEPQPVEGSGRRRRRRGGFDGIFGKIMTHHTHL